MFARILFGDPRTAFVGLVVCILFLPATVTSGQEAPLLETRGVWFATVLRDGGWPRFPTDSAEKQEADLRARIREAWSLGLNTFVFQAVARGDAMYRSSRLPWSVRLGGAGVDPGYDPLAVAIDECHKLGMELHAWINTYRIGDLSTVTAFENVTEPGHVYYQNPGWVGTRNEELWLDPSSAAARDWLVANVMEIVEGYDIDAVHFDFIRYPTGGLTDDLASFQFDPRGFADIEDWRRNNVTLFVESINAAIYAVKPWVKVGSAPFGNYQSFDGAWPAAWAYSDVFQESRAWLAAGTHDYVAPQIYFDIGREPEPPNSYDSPDFAFLVDEWVSNAANRAVFSGHGPYKSVVHEELDDQIARARTAGAGGQIFFRFDHIRTFDFGTSYPTRALPFPMQHRFELAPPSMVSGETVGVQNVNDSAVVSLAWSHSSGTTADPLRGYAVFGATGRDPVATDPADLVGWVDVANAGFTETVASVEATDRRYVAVAVSRLGARAMPSDVMRTTVVASEELFAGPPLRIAAIWPLPGDGYVNVQVESPRNQYAEISLLDVSGRVVFNRRVSLGLASATTEVLDVSLLAVGVYLVVVRAGQSIATRRLVVAR